MDDIREQIKNQIEFLEVMANNPGRSITKREALSMCRDTLEKLLAVYEAAIPCARGCRRCDSFERQYKLQEALDAVQTKEGGG